MRCYTVVQSYLLHVLKDDCAYLVVIVPIPRPVTRGAYVGEAGAIDVVHEHLGGHDEFLLGLQCIHQQIALHVLLKQGLQIACMPVFMADFKKRISLSCKYLESQNAFEEGAKCSL